MEFDLDINMSKESLLLAPSFLEVGKEGMKLNDSMRDTYDV